MPVEHLAIQCFPVLTSSSHDRADDFPFAEDSGLQLQTTALPFNDSQVIAMAGDAKNLFQLMAVMLFKLATTRRVVST